MSPALLLARIQTFVTVFLGIFIEALPFLLAGTLASGLIEVFISREWVLRFSPRNSWVGALTGTLLGLVFPVCECGVVPLTRRLLRKGLPLPMATGSVFALARDPGRVLLVKPDPAVVCCRIGEAVEREATKTSSQRRRWVQAMVVIADEFFEMGRYLVLGALLAAGMQTLVPQSLLLGMGHGPVTSVLVLLLLAFLLSVCSTVDAFVSLAFANTFSTGALLAFLVLGPMMDVKSLAMFLGVFRRRAVAYLVLLPLAAILFAALCLNLLVGW
jgi:uncharacterized protein